MVHLAGIPLTGILESFVRGETLLSSRRGQPFSALCALIDSGRQANGPLEQTLTSLPTLHAVIPDEVLLVLPGRWDGDDEGAVWSTLSRQDVDAPSMLHPGPPSAEVATVEFQAGTDAGEASPLGRAPHYAHRTRAVVDFVTGGKERARDVRTFSILGVNDLLDWLGVGPGLDPSVLFLCSTECRAVFVRTGETLDVVSLFAGLRDSLHARPGHPAEAVLEICRRSGVVDEEILAPVAETLAGWSAVRMTTPRLAPPPSKRILG